MLHVCVCTCTCTCTSGASPFHLHVQYMHSPCLTFSLSLFLLLFFLPPFLSSSLLYLLSPSPLKILVLLSQSLRFLLVPPLLHQHLCISCVMGALSPALKISLQKNKCFSGKVVIIVSLVLLFIAVCYY